MTSTATPVLAPDRPAPTLSELRALVEMYYDAQKFRIRGTNRMKALLRGATAAERLALAVQKLKEMEDVIVPAIAQALKQEPVAPWLLAQRGIGPTLAGAIVASGLNPEIDKPSAWWRFAGVGIVDGKNQRLRRGEKRSYSGFLRRTLYVALGSFLKSHQPDKGRPSFYADLYYQFKAESERDREGLQPIHHHSRAAMLTQRVFLTHLQQRWREALSLGPARQLYIVEKEPGVHEAIPAP